MIYIECFLFQEFVHSISFRIPTKAVFGAEFYSQHFMVIQSLCSRLLFLLFGVKI